MAQSAGDGASSSSNAQHQDTQQQQSITYMSPYVRSDFISQETKIEIFPKFELGRIRFMTGEFGPFSPNYPITVPLWLALFLRETNTCTIRCPEDLQVTTLTRILEYEGENDHVFHPLPLHFFSLVRQILRYAAADIPDAAVVHRLVDELEQRRISKITKNMGVLAVGEEGLPPRALSAGALTTSELLVLKSSLHRVVNDGVEMRARAEQRLARPGAAGGRGGAAAGGAGGTSTAASSYRPFGSSTSAASTSDYFDSSVGVTNSNSSGGGGGGGRATTATTNSATNLPLNMQQYQQRTDNRTAGGAGDAAAPAPSIFLNSSVSQSDGYFGGAPGETWNSQTTNNFLLGSDAGTGGTGGGATSSDGQSQQTVSQTTTDASAANPPRRRGLRG